MKVFKYELDPSTQKLELPVAAQVLTVQVQNGCPYIWALVDETLTTTETRYFPIYGTGHRMRSGPRTYVGTFQLESGALVFHVFEETLA